MSRRPVLTNAILLTYIRATNVQPRRVSRRSEVCELPTAKSTLSYCWVAKSQLFAWLEEPQQRKAEGLIHSTKSHCWDENSHDICPKHEIWICHDQS